jgi:flagellar assembly protein FliH
MVNRMSEEEEFQSSSEDIEIKPWDLPYWRGAPKLTSKEVAEQEAEEAVEQDVEVVEPITVEELEAIRNEGYEEGFLQGLNEGREKGEKEGEVEGKAEGHKEGLKEGTQEGNRIGFEAGEAKGLASGKDEINQASIHLAELTQQLEQSLVEKDSALPQVLSQLIRTACETIIERELEQGDNQITKKVLSALEQLPSGAENIKIYVSPSDAVHLEHGLSNSGREMHFNIDDALSVGSARITTKQSLIEFSHQERMEKVFELIDQECEKLDLTDIAGEAAVEKVSEAEELVVEEANAEEIDDSETIEKSGAEEIEALAIEETVAAELDVSEKQEEPDAEEANATVIEDAENSEEFVVEESQTELEVENLAAKDLEEPDVEASNIEKQDLEKSDIEESDIEKIEQAITETSDASNQEAPNQDAPNQDASL